MDDRINQRAETAFEAMYDVAFAAVLAPIDPAMPAGGRAARSTYHGAIAQARREDDASLPMGGWVHEFKRADWDKAASLSLEALRHHGKDLQLAAWALEAGIHLHGFAGLAAGLHLVRSLCMRYWDDMYPQAPAGDMEHRNNVFAWIDQKLLPAVRLVPVAHGRAGQAYALADWELARRRASLTAAAPDVDGPREVELAAALAALPQAQCAATAQALSDAACLLDGLADTLAALAGVEAPRFPHLARVLEYARGIVDGEVRRRAAPAPARAAATGPAARAVLHHLSLGVRDLQAAAAFHDAALGALGWRRVFEDDEAIGYGVEDGQDLLCLKLRGDATPPGPGFHLALGVQARAAVDGFHAAGLAAGGVDNGAPGLREEYGPDYYAAFLVDPDGHHIEAVAKGRGLA